MKFRADVLWLFLWLLPVKTRAIEPISVGIAITLASALTGFLSHRNFYCNFLDCCNTEEALNRTALEEKLHKHVFGQHLATQVVLKALPGFIRNSNPKKPLTLSFHGWTGTGKNFISKIIAESIYKDGMKSKYVHHFEPTLHFPNPDFVNKYKDQLQAWIRGNVSLCSRSVFVFDEMDKMPPGVIDSIKPFLDYYEQIDGVSYRKAVFIFLSNAGGDKINEVTLNFWQSGKNREQIQLKDIESSVSLGVFNNKESGFWHASLIEKNLIDFFVPFLPLEYKHVRMCVEEEIKARGFKVDVKIVNSILDEVQFFPVHENIFAKKGCKALDKKVDYYEN